MDSEEYYIKNKEKKKQDSRDYNIKNKEIISEKKKNYNIKNKEKISTYMKEYRENNKEKLKKSKSEYGQINKNIISLHNLEARHNNVIKYLCKKAKERAKLKNIEYDNKIESFLKDAYQENNYCRCFNVLMLINREKHQINSITIDRVDPSIGYSIGNVQLICYRANSIKNCANINDIEKIINFMGNLKYKKIEKYKITSEIVKWAKLKVSDLKRRAKNKNLKFDLDYDDIINIIPYNFKCPILGFDLKFSSIDRMLRPSIDRIIPEEGYVKNNIQLISLKANSIKNNASIDELKQVRDYMLKYTKGRK
ncbi:MAG: hypothetical protein ACOYMA_00230 [Bacteroidia bacterium]